MYTLIDLFQVLFTGTFHTVIYLSRTLSTDHVMQLFNSPFYDDRRGSVHCVDTVVHSHLCGRAVQKKNESMLIIALKWLITNTSLTVKLLLNSTYYLLKKRKREEMSCIIPISYNLRKLTVQKTSFIFRCNKTTKQLNANELIDK